MQGPCGTACQECSRCSTERLRGRGLLGGLALPPGERIHGREVHEWRCSSSDLVLKGDSSSGWSGDRALLRCPRRGAGARLGRDGL